MRFTVKRGDVNVTIHHVVCDEGECYDSVTVTYTNASEPGTEPPFTVEADAETADQLRALIACAEPEGSETALRVLNVLDRTEKLMNEWQAAVKGK